MIWEADFRGTTAVAVYCTGHCGQPGVILIDEPCSALDPIATATIEELINELCERYTIVIVTHSMQQAARFPMGGVFSPGRARGGRGNVANLRGAEESAHPRLY